VYHTVAVLALIACSSGKSEPPRPAELEAAPESPGSADDHECVALDWAASIDIAEASGADITPAADGVLVVADSGHRGDYLIADLETGEVRERGSLPLGRGGDDLEGAAFSGDRLYALSSSGHVYSYDNQDGGFALIRQPYPIGPKPWRCGLRRSNCGPNWEGLCLADRDLSINQASCRGFAASKSRGALYCVTIDDGALTLRPEVSIKVSPRLTLAGCAISGDRIWAVTNILGANAILEVGLDGVVTPRLTMAPGSNEAVAAAGDVIYRFSDTSDRPSLAGRYRCK
jgi:hypothetical protein